MKLKGKCDCGEQLNCGCTLSFSSYIANPVSSLDVGTLQGGSCTFSEYVIDWYRNGNIELVSGIGSNPEIEALHPFTGAAAIPVQGGTWVPVLRYVILTGQTTKIYSGKTKCQTWCNFNGTLPTIEVSCIYCDTISGSPPTGYNYKISYVTTLDYSLASRTIRFCLPEDGSAKYMAFYFSAFSVADKCTIYLNETTELDSYIVGTRFNANTTGSYPRKLALTEAKWLMAIPAYQPGDYLKIVITPSVLETNYLTEWWLALKCLFTDLSNTECLAWPLTLRNYNVNNFAMTQNAASCRWEFNPGIAAIPTTSFPTIAQYVTMGIGVSTIGAGNGGYLNTTGSRMYFNYGRTGSRSYKTTTNTATYSCSPITVVKYGPTFTFTFDSNADYLYYYNRWQALIATDWDDLWNSDPTNYAYYRFFRIDMYYTEVGCGDVGTSSASYTFHKTTVVTWGVDGNGKDYMTFTPQLITNQLTKLPTCDTGYTMAGTDVNGNNTSYNLGNSTRMTRCTKHEPLLGWNVIYADSFTTVNGYQGYHYVIYPQMLPCAPANWCNSGFYRFFYFTFKVTITNTSDPAGNYKVEDYAYGEGACVSTADLTRVFEKQNGIVVYP